MESHTEQTEHRKLELNCLVVGESNIGKTGLIRALHSQPGQDFVLESLPTIGIECSSSTHQIKNIELVLHLWELQMKDIDFLWKIDDINFEFVFLCFAAERSPRLKKLQEFKKKFEKTKYGSAQFIIVGCCSDLLSSLSPTEFVDYLKNAQKYANQMKSSIVFTSSKAKVFINDYRKMIFDAFLSKKLFIFDINSMVKNFERNTQVELDA
ncbi:small GTP-binding protein [Histomonas meleagridis]|uniref:small GTP-binding protein n=1 Tax=Histomonas meleagridis TaxID=135588 RepID=UPI003559F014|nr:small GTP-binding protein [Histomonas meleagridis]KAH0799116.1 small GTP-binding protein [Histomonas meleagridis]